MQQLIKELRTVIPDITPDGMSNQKLLRTGLLALGYRHDEINSFLNAKSRDDWSKRKTVAYVRKEGRSSYSGTVHGGGPGLGKRK